MLLHILLRKEVTRCLVKQYRIYPSDTFEERFIPNLIGQNECHVTTRLWIAQFQFYKLLVGGLDLAVLAASRRYRHDCAQRRLQRPAQNL